MNLQLPSPHLWVPKIPPLVLAREFPTPHNREFPTDLDREFPAVGGGGGGGGGGDPNFNNVQLLLGFEDPDASTTTTDESNSGRTVTFGTQAETDTAQSKFGTSSLLLNPSGSVNPSEAFISLADDDVWTPDNDFTAEGFFRFADLTAATQTFFGHYNNSGNNRSWFLRRQASTLELITYSNGFTVAVNMSGSFTWAIDTWYHVAFSRSGDDYRQFIDGIQIGSTVNDSSAVFNSTQVFYVGKLRSTGFDDFPMDGWADEIRMTDTVARYTAGFTPPSEPFPRSL